MIRPPWDATVRWGRNALGSPGRTSVRQSSRARRRPDYAALDSGTLLDEAKYRGLLEQRQFVAADFPSVDGADLTVSYLRQHGFLEPILVAEPAGLGMVMPPAPFTVDDVARLVGTASSERHRSVSARQPAAKRDNCAGRCGSARPRPCRSRSRRLCN